MDRKISRRQLLKGAGLVVAGAAANSVLSACAGSSPPVAATTAPITAAAATTGAPTTAVASTSAPAGAATAAATMTATTEATTAAAPIGAGGAVSLPADALPADQQFWLTGIGQVGGGFGHIMESLYNRAFEHNGGAETLTTLDINLNVVGVGAESWKVSEDGKYWDFTLRKGLTFSDGKPVTAKDWVYTLRHSLSHNYDFAWFYFDVKNAQAVAGGKAKPEELGIEARDDYTLRIYTEAPTPYLPAIGVWFEVAPDGAWEKLGDNWALDPKRYVSSGPYILSVFQRDVQHKWTSNKKYSGVRKVYFNEIREQNLPKGLPPYMAGEVQGYAVDSNAPAGEVALINANPILRAESHPQPSTNTDYLGFNTLPGKFKPLDNPDVRMALCKAIDKEKLIGEIFRGFANPAWGILPKGFPNYIGDQLKAMDPNKYDPAVAKQLLSKAGYPDGKGFPKFELWIRQPTPVMTALSQAIQARWKENLGIQVDLKPADFQSFTDTTFAKKNAPMYYVNYSLDYYDPATFLNVFRSTGRHPHQDPAWDASYNKANAILNLTERFKQLQQAEQKLVASTAWYFLANPFSIALWPCNLAGAAVKPNKDGYQFNAGGGPGCVHAYEDMYWTKSGCRVGLS